MKNKKVTKKGRPKSLEAGVKISLSISAKDKAKLETLSKEKGFGSMSEFIRHLINSESDPLASQMKSMITKIKTNLEGK